MSEDSTTSGADDIMRHVMTLIQDDDNGTVFKILQHAGVVHPLDLFTPLECPR